ncbi:hypothetical protein LTS18_001031, partial [Coniosporium uncinatum]
MSTDIRRFRIRGEDGRQVEGKHVQGQTGQRVTLTDGPPQTDNSDDEFVLARLLFLCTYETNVDFDKLVRAHQVADRYGHNVARHTKRYSRSVRKPSMPNMMDEMALCETLKLLFNITHYYPDLVDQFSKSVPHLLKMLHRSRLSHPPLQPPVNYLINALLNLNMNDKKIQEFSLSPVFPKLDKTCNVEHLINILDRAVTDYKESELDHVATPVLNLIRKIHGFAPESVKKFMQWLLLPQEGERDKPLGKSDTLASKLLKLSTSPASPALRNSISHMLFELSDKDAN